MYFRLSTEQRQASKDFLTLIDIINETVGDAISDMLLVETILHARGWDIAQWESCYTDLPNKLLKVTVKVNIFLGFFLILCKVLRIVGNFKAIYLCLIIKLSRSLNRWMQLTASKIICRIWNKQQGLMSSNYVNPLP